MEFIFQMIADLFHTDNTDKQSEVVADAGGLGFLNPMEAPLAEEPLAEANIFTMMEFH